MNDSMMAFARVSQFTIIIPLTIALLRYKSLTIIQRLIGLITLLTLLAESIGLMMVELLHILNNLPVYNSFALVLFVLINRIYAITCDGAGRKRMLDVLLVSFVVLSIVNIVLIQPIDTFNSNIITAASLIYISLVILHFIDLLRVPKHMRLERQPIFWFSTGILIYHSTTLILFLLINYVIEGSKELIVMSLGLNSILNIVLNTFYAVSLSLKAEVKRKPIG